VKRIEAILRFFREHPYGPDRESETDRWLEALSKIGARRKKMLEDLRRKFPPTQIENMAQRTLIAGARQGGDDAIGDLMLSVKSIVQAHSLLAPGLVLTSDRGAANEVVEEIITDLLKCAPDLHPLELLALSATEEAPDAC
jgi:hypothetical protein